MIKGCTFAGVFLISLIVLSLFMNKGNTDMTAEMGPATLPLVSMQIGEARVNEMHGHVKRMDEGAMREGILPIGSSRQVKANVETFGRTIDKIRYEVRSLDGGRLIENTEVASFTEQDGNIPLEFTLKDLIEEGEEYNLVLVLQLDDGSEVRYYNRVVTADYAAEEKIAFVREFHNTTFDKEAVSQLRTYLEPNSEADNGTLQTVTIHSSVKQLGWGDLDVQRVTEPVVTIREIATQTASITLEYVVSYPDQGKECRALVQEYYRIRQTADRTYLLDYEREMEQIFTEKSTSFGETTLSLGIADSGLELVESDGGNVFAFVQAGVLYSFNVGDQKLARLYGFYDDKHFDGRTLYDSHDYKILQVDETGNVMFLVYGYMNRGKHEGDSGVQVCRYDSMVNTVEELAFLPGDKAADVLAADVENLAYVNGRNELFLLQDGVLSYIVPEQGTCDTVAQNLSEDSYQVSADGSMVVWISGEERYAGESLILMNLNTGQQSLIRAGEGNYIYPLGFMGSDVIYGKAAVGDVERSMAGETVFPMYQVFIEDARGNVLKTYSREGIYVTGCRVENNQIVLERVTWQNGYYQRIEDDQIVNNETERTRKNTVSASTSETLQRVVTISLGGETDPKKIKILTPREVMFEGSREIVTEKSEAGQTRFYVYGKDGVVDICSDVSTAVEMADAEAGAVTDPSGAYIWKRDRLHTSNQIMAIQAVQAQEGESTLAVCLNQILQFNGVVRNAAELLAEGDSAITILEEGLEGKRILDLKNVTLNEVLYYPDREIPVLALQKDGSAVIICGFNDQNVVIADPAAGTVAKKGLNDAAEWFAGNTDSFITYVEEGGSLPIEG